MDKAGIPLTKKWTKGDDIYEMRFEYHKVNPI